MNPHLAVIGSFVVGVTVRLPRTPLPGESLVADLFDIGPGGKGCNLAVAAARLGARVDVIAKIGTDRFAAYAEDLFRQEELDTKRLLRSTTEPTGVGLVYLDGRSGENTIGVYPGANLELTAAEVTEALRGLEDVSLVSAQLEVRDEVVLRAFSWGRSLRITTLLNPAPARTLPDDLLGLTDIITPNANELFQLLGEDVPPLEDQVLENAARRLQARGPRSVVVTLGAKGALVLDEEGTITRVAARAVPVVDTVGAGDAFSAGLAVARAGGATLLDSVEYGSVCGALATRTVGVVDALPRRDEVEAFLQ